MYIPASFKEDRLETLHGLMRSHPLGMLVTHGAEGLHASPLPFLLLAEEGKFGTLQAHLARANPHWKTFADLEECLVIFQGADGYVTPSWYPGKAATHKAVPTWNYASVHVWGIPVIKDDPTWLDDQLQALTCAHESSRAQPWSLTDAPADFIAAQKKALIGLEIRITRIEGKWKMSQNKEAADRDGVIRGMLDAGDPHQNPAVAELVKRCGQA